MNMLHYFFHWYDGSVWSNLVASAITFTIVEIRNERRHRALKKHLGMK